MDQKRTRLTMCNAYPLYSNVLMLNPNVGDISSISSPLNFFTIVVLPALSKPLSLLHQRQGAHDHVYFTVVESVRTK